MRSDEKEQSFERGSAGSPNAASALRTRHVGRLEEDRSETNPSALHTTVGLFQLQDCNPLFEAARRRFSPMRVVASRTVHHSGIFYPLRSCHSSNHAIW